MHIVFLPGAGGAAEFWHPLGNLLPSEWRKTYLSWPGLGNQVHDPDVNGFDDLVALAEKTIPGSAVVVAQSMGGIVGVRLALEFPEKVSRLVLVASSGGLDVSGMGGANWRDAYLADFPASRKWITTDLPDFSREIPDIACPTLLIWGDCDPISPLAVGKHLSTLIRQSKLQIIEGGDHNLGRERAHDIAPSLIAHATGARGMKTH